MSDEDKIEFVAVTTRARAKRHWSPPKTAQWGYSPLCGSTPRGFDQDQIDESMPAQWRKRKVIVDMPPCKQCDKSRQRRIDRRPS